MPKTKLFARTNTTTAKATLRMYWQELAQDKRTTVIYSILVPTSKLLSAVILPLIFSLLIQALITNPHDTTAPMWLLLAGVITCVISVTFNTQGLNLLFKQSERLCTNLAKKAMQGMLAHSYQFFSNKKIGSLSNDFNGFNRGIVIILDQIFLHAIGIIVNFIASLIVIAIIAPVLLIPLTLMTLLLIWRSIVAVQTRAVYRNQRKKATSALNGLVADVLGNQLLVRMFAKESTETQSVLNKRQHIEDIAHKEIAVMNHESSVRQIVLYSFQLGTLAICAWLFSTNLISIAALIFTITYLGRVTASLFDITPIFRNVEQALLDSSAMTEMLMQPTEIQDKKGAKPLHVRDGAVTFNAISFKYEDAKHDTVFDNLSLAIKPGEKVGVAGPSGGGKTTFTKLLLRFIDVQSGSIEIDGQNIADVTQTSLRKAVAYVPQEPLLFHRSLRENIAYGKEDATDQEIMAAVKRAHAEDFIEKLPGGLDTIVGERGVKLSGGQRQRVAIARAILKDAPILVLDEATSALDSESEHLVQKALDELMQGRTTIVVAHRLSTIQKMDRILVFEDGHITEQGSHSALLQKNGLYKKLWSHQSGGFIED